MNKTRFNSLLDIALCILFIAILISIIGGEVDSPRAHAWNTVHSISGFLFVMGCAVHQALHWSWIKTVILNPVGDLPTSLRRKRCLSLWLFGLFFICGLTGLLSLTLMNGLSSPADPPLRILARIHEVSGVASLVLISWHLALHSRRFVSSTRHDLVHDKVSNVQLTQR